MFCAARAEPIERTRGDDIAMDDLDPLVEVFPLQKQYQWCNHIFVSHPYAMLEFFETAFF